jgi:hypothetical protein
VSQIHEVRLYKHWLLGKMEQRNCVNVTGICWLWRCINTIHWNTLPWLWCYAFGTMCLGWINEHMCVCGITTLNPCCAYLGCNTLQKTLVHLRSSESSQKILCCFFWRKWPSSSDCTDELIDDATPSLTSWTNPIPEYSFCSSHTCFDGHYDGIHIIWQRL